MEVRTPPEVKADTSQKWQLLFFFLLAVIVVQLTFFLLGSGDDYYKREYETLHEAHETHKRDYARLKADYIALLRRRMALLEQLSANPELLRQHFPEYKDVGQPDLNKTVWKDVGRLDARIKELEGGR